MQNMAFTLPNFYNQSRVPGQPPVTLQGVMKTLSSQPPAQLTFFKKKIIPPRDRL